MPSVRALIMWVALAAAVALLFFSSRLVTDLRDRLVAAERRAVVAEGARQTAEEQAAAAVSALATTTAAPLARVTDARGALEQALATTFEALKDPTPEKIAAVSAAYASQPLVEVMPEIDHLRSEGLYLGGRSAYELNVLSVDALGEHQVLIRTNERWIYDELTPQGETVRCVQEIYDVAYVLQRDEDVWLIQELRLEGPAQREECE